MMERTGTRYRALWCPGFMENTLRQVQAIKHRSAFFGPEPANVKTKLVATRDIAVTAARLLLDESWTGQGGVAVLGPEDLSCNDRAQVMSEALGKPIRFQPIPPEDYKSQLLENGASEAMAQGLVDLSADIYEHGIYNAEPRTPENTTPTTFRAWCEEILAPAVLGDAV